MYWESHLTHRVVPEKCKLVVKRLRGDMKLLKAEEISWAEFEVSLACLCGWGGGVARQ